MKVIRCSYAGCRKCVPERKAVQDGQKLYCSNNCCTSQLISEKLRQKDAKKHKFGEK